MPVDRSQLRRMIDSMEKALTIMESNQKARHDEERQMEEEDCHELETGNTLPVAPSAPFSIYRLLTYMGSPSAVYSNGERRWPI